MSKQYYVYYDNKTKQIFSVTNEEDPNYDTGIRAEYDEIKKFLSGEWHFKDFVVDYVAGTSDLAIISNIDQSINFENNEFALVVEDDKDAEFIIEYNIPNRAWYFQLDPAYKSTIKGVFNSKMSFFVTLEADHDFLIRTITIDADQLISNYHLCVPFEEEIETDLSKISISTRMIFKNYKLKVVHEN